MYKVPFGTSGWLAGIERRHGSALRLASCFLVVALATAFVTAMEAGTTDIACLWIANGVVLAYVLTAPRWRWKAILIVGFLAQFLGGVLVDGDWKGNVVYASLNLVEVLLSAWLLRRRSTELPKFTESAYLLRFVSYAVVLGPVVSALMYAPFSRFWFHEHVIRGMVTWAAGDGLGTAVTTPACVAIFRDGLGACRKVERPWLYPGLVVVVAVAGFSQSRIPILFLVYPLLVLVLLQLGMAWAALGALFVALTGSFFTLHGLGPLLLMHSLTSAGPIVMLQLYLISGMFMLYSISIVLDRMKGAERRLQEIVSLHHLVTENSRDVIILSDFHGRRRYVSAAAEKMGGWRPEEMLQQKAIELVHPEDRPRIQLVLRGLQSGREAAMVECRVRKQDGSYLWVEASLKTVRDPATGKPTGILNMVRDISERKAAEAELHNAYRALEALAVTDSLTRLANRRRFDQYLTGEWRRGMRERSSLSLLLIDVDLFKSYNDTYGHLRGDSCLKQLAEAAQDVVTRPGDLVARFGGEEFAIVLPNTGNEGAMEVAGQVCEALRRRSLPHSASPLGYLTISVGCATMTPQLGQHAATLIQMADDALYAAKNNGRNQVCNANTSVAESAVWQAS